MTLFRRLLSYFAPMHAGETIGRYPKTLHPYPPDGASRPYVFDPALKHFRHGIREGDPVLSDPARFAAWRDVRRRALAHVLRSINESPAASHLVLRGSLPLQAWLGDAFGRDPGDVDYVVTPESMVHDGPKANELVSGACRAVVGAGGAIDPAVSLLIEHVASDDIWTYDRAPGRRLVFLFRPTDPGLPAGAVQVDFVFNENLPLETGVTAIPAAGGPPIRVRTAPKELALAWKILWLATDVHAQGKDLYDATLLAEHLKAAGTPMPRALLDHILTEAFKPHAPRLEVFEWDVDWDNFKKECPHIPGTLDDWRARLTTALIPTLAAP